MLDTPTKKRRLVKTRNEVAKAEPMQAAMWSSKAIIIDILRPNLRNNNNILTAQPFVLLAKMAEGSMAEDSMSEPLQLDIESVRSRPGLFCLGCLWSDTSFLHEHRSTYT